MPQTSAATCTGVQTPYVVTYEHIIKTNKIQNLHKEEQKKILKVGLKSETKKMCRHKKNTLQGPNVPTFSIEGRDRCVMMCP